MSTPVSGPVSGTPVNRIVVLDIVVLDIVGLTPKLLKHMPEGPLPG